MSKNGNFSIDDAIESMDNSIQNSENCLEIAKAEAKFQEGYMLGLKKGMAILKSVKRGLEDEHNNENAERTETV